MDQQPTNRTLGNQGSAGVTESLPDLVTWNASDIPYRYRRSRRRTLCITVYPDLSVLVRAPMRAKPELIREFVLKHALWIIKTRRKLESRSVSKPPVPQYTTGETHAYLGRTYPLELRSGDGASVAFLSDCIQVTAKGEPTAETVRKLLFRWYRTEAETIFHERLAACPPKDADGRPSASSPDPPDENPLGQLLTARKDHPESMAHHNARRLP